MLRPLHDYVVLEKVKEEEKTKHPEINIFPVIHDGLPLAGCWQGVTCQLIMVNPR